MKDKLKGVLIATGVIAVLATRRRRDRRAPPAAATTKRRQAITGSALDRASQAALKEAGSGKVTETEAGDEEGAYEVEVTKADGSQVDVHLDKSFAVDRREGRREDGGDDGRTGSPATARALDPADPRDHGPWWPMRPAAAGSTARRTRGARSGRVTVTERTRRIANGVTARVVPTS